MKNEIALLLKSVHELNVSEVVDNVPSGDFIAFKQLVNIKRSYDEFKKYVEIYAMYVNSLS